MSARHRVVRLVLAVLTVWPLLHYFLVSRYGASPWHFFGWAMYTVPRAPLAVELFDARGAPLPLERFPRELDEEIRRYGERRRAWGDLLPPDELAQRLFASVPWLRKIEIVVTTYRFDPGEARFVSSQRRYPYAR